jgi:hypothetical protein
VFDKKGNLFSSFKIFKPCSSMGVDNQGHIFINFLEINSDESPLISIFDEFGHSSGQIGSRLKSNSPLFNEVEISIVGDGILVAWKTFPLIRKYSKSGILLFEHYLDYGPLRAYGQINKYAKEEQHGTTFKTVIWKIWAEKDFYYLLIAYPRLEILKIDINGKIRKIYWDDVPDDFYVSDFCIQREDAKAKIYILEQGPIPCIRAYNIEE